MIHDLRTWTMSPYTWGDLLAAVMHHGWYFSEEAERALPIPIIYDHWSGIP